MGAVEEVLVFKREIFDDLGAFHGLKFDVEDYLRKIFEPGVLRFMPRPEAEADPSFKQLIPYVLMEHDGKYLNYVRGKRAGETRLVGNRSMGIGGHINPIDHNVEKDCRHMYLTAVEREVTEEVNVATGHQERIVALLNDDTNEVGQVHLGLVHHWRLDEPSVTRKEQMITQLTFTSLDELDKVKDTMETWSSLCVEGIEKMGDSFEGVDLETLFG